MEACPACGFSVEPGGETSPFQRISHGDVVYGLFECADCKSVFAEPRTAASGVWYAEVGEWYGWRWEFDQVLSDLKGTSRLRILEIGCGEGVLLERLRLDHEVWGIDINSLAVRRARGKGVRAYACTIEQFVAGYPSLSFDAVLFFHVLEHLPDPMAFLRVLRRILNPGGRLFFSVPNERRFTLQMGHERWDYPPHHLTRFTRAGLVRLLTRAGYRAVELRDQPNDISARSWTSLYCDVVLQKFIASDLRSWPRAVRVAVKGPLAPLGWLQFWALIRKRQNYTGLALYVIASLDGAR